MFINIVRVIKSGLTSLKRDTLLSVTTIFIIALNLIVIGGILMFSVMTQEILKGIEEKINISIYFKDNVKEAEIRAIEGSLSTLKEIKNIEYISKNDALDKFKEKRKDDIVIIETIEELEANPLQNSLKIKATNTSDYPKIISFLEVPEFKTKIDTINYYENEKVLSRINNIVAGVEKSGTVLAIILSIIAILITFSTIKLAIYSLREDITVMRLVGATNWFIRGPFITEGIIYGLTSALIAIIILYYGLGDASEFLKIFLEGYDIFSYFKTNLIKIFALLAAIGVLLSTASTLIAIRKYLKV